MLHPLSRAVLKTLEVPAPEGTLACVYSNNINPFGGRFKSYPSRTHDTLKSTYLRALSKIKNYENCLQGLSLDQILVTTGGVDGLDLILKAFAEPGQDLICIPKPSFSAFFHWAKLYKLALDCPWLEGENYDALPPEYFIDNKSKLLVLCSPNNPVGCLFPLAVIRKISQLFKGLIVIDEAYLEFSDGESSISLIRENPNIIVLKTFSKAWGMAGVRCGLVFSSSIVIETLRYVQTPFPLSSGSEIYVKNILKNPCEIIQSWEKIKKSRKNFKRKIEVLDCVRRVFKSDANFLSISFRHFKKVIDHLNKCGIYGSQTHSLVPNTLRISISTPYYNNKLLNALASFTLSLEKL